VNALRLPGLHVCLSALFPCLQLSKLSFREDRRERRKEEKSKEKERKQKREREKKGFISQLANSADQLDPYALLDLG